MTAPMSTGRAIMFLAAGAAAALVAQGSDAKAQSTTPRATNIAVTTPGAAQGLTTEQCKIFKGHLTDFIKDVGRQNLSDDFVGAMVELAINRKCAAPASIPIRVQKDLEVFGAIDSIMYGTQGVQLKKMGIVPVNRTASLQ